MSTQEQTKQKQQERDEQEAQISGQEPVGIPKALDPISESETSPGKETEPVTTSLAQNLDVEDKNPMSTESSQKVEEDQEDQEENLTKSHHESQGESQGNGQKMYSAEGALVDL